MPFNLKQVKIDKISGSTKNVRDNISPPTFINQAVIEKIKSRLSGIGESGHRLNTTKDAIVENFQPIIDGSGVRTVKIPQVLLPRTIEEQIEEQKDILKLTPYDKIIEYFFLKENKKHAFSFTKNNWYNKQTGSSGNNALELCMHIIAENEGLSNKDIQSNQHNLEKQSMRLLYDIQKAHNLHSTQKVENKKNMPTEFKNSHQEHIEQLDLIPLDLVMEFIGASPNADNQRGKWKVHGTGHNIQITGQKWKNWNSYQKGGIGAIGLLAHHFGIIHNINESDPASRKYLRNMAIKELSKSFSKSFIEPLTSKNNINKQLSVSQQLYKEPLYTPHLILERNMDIKEYLITERGIPEWVVEKQIKAGLLSAGYPSDWKTEPLLKTPALLPKEKIWACFFSPNGNAAELRAIKRSDEYSKMLAKGSDKDLGGFVIKAEPNLNEKTVVVCEAAIDAMSCHSIYPGRITMSCMGTSIHLAVRAAEDSLNAGYTFALGFDNDNAGISASMQFINELKIILGDTTVDDLIKEHKIRPLEFAMHVFEQSSPFYLSTTNDQLGKSAAKLFHSLLIQKYSTNRIKQRIENNSLKYLNITPNFYLISDPYLEAKTTLDKLLSKKITYLIEDMNEEIDNTIVEKKRHRFYEYLYEIGGETISKLKQSGSILESRPKQIKDWNEYLIQQTKKTKQCRLI